MERTTICARDRVVIALRERYVSLAVIEGLQLPDVVVDPDAEYLEPRAAIPLGHGSHQMVVDDDLRRLLEDYLNAAPSSGRPFLDYRPDIGSHVFPSARTGEGLTRRCLHEIVQSHANADPPAEDHTATHHDRVVVPPAVS